MKRVLSVVRIVVICVLILILAVNLYLIGARLIGGARNPKIFGVSTSIVLSGSMEPEFYGGDMLIYKEKDRYEVGDIVIFSQGGSFVTHRIIGQSERGFITKGDHNNTQDTEPVSPDAIDGAVVYVVPKIGSFLLFLRSPFGMLVLVVAGFLLVELPDITDFLRRKKGKYAKE